MFVEEDSDWDVWLIVRVGAFADYEERYDSEHGDPVEIGTDTVAGLRAHGEPGTSHWWNRYAFRHAKVLVDKLDGEIGEIVDSKRTLPDGCCACDRRCGTRRLCQQHLSVAQGPPSRPGDRSAPGCRRRREPPARRAVRLARSPAALVEVPALGARVGAARSGCRLACRRVPRPPREPPPRTFAGGPAAALPRRRGARPQRRSRPGARHLGAVALVAARNEERNEEGSS